LKNLSGSRITLLVHRVCHHEHGFSGGSSFAEGPAQGERGNRLAVVEGISVTEEVRFHNCGVFPVSRDSSAIVQEEDLEGHLAETIIRCQEKRRAGGHGIEDVLHEQIEKPVCRSKIKRLQLFTEFPLGTNLKRPPQARHERVQLPSRDGFEQGFLDSFPPREVYEHPGIGHVIRQCPFIIVQSRLFEIDGMRILARSKERVMFAQRTHVVGHSFLDVSYVRSQNGDRFESSPLVRFLKPVCVPPIRR
jgi:hypothetical protein